ncbi:HAMP domain-containing histidine kinase [Corynebacterium hadale]|uniref:sensor histidine kinase n=1 Tax=Corynebacterium hadale TaxID=2026255 RepID=UPI001EF3209F|nr:HAMP domain-containing sensor histidine kinase [Corynebacterium hadale]MCG7254724.1 HAMP domain-containing histidine kinase [Corynebacterium hadale]MCG7257137.1 HAMP domain-containing histidine kinase [Corynebacterium hadale]MCG7265604.1 HAMP domain-containing histidine kinase [Corynebacterium hadale]
MKAKQTLAAWSYNQASRPLQKQLVSLVVVVATLGIVLSFATVFFLMRGILMQRVDDQLQEGLDSWAGQGTWIPSIGVPSEFAQATWFPGYPYPFSRYTPRGNPPDWEQLTVLDQARTIGSKNVDSSASLTQWRAVASKSDDGTITLVAKRLESENRILRWLAVVETSLGAIAILAIAIAARTLVRRSLTPLREVEDTALAIADGDVDRRVPAWSRDTEVGKLSYAVNTMVGQLQESVDEAQAKEEQMRRFVGDASHELRTPLTSLRGYAELYRKGMAPDADMVIDKIEEESGRMQLLVEDLLALTRAEGTRLDRKTVDMQKVVDSAVSSARAAYPERSIEVDNQCARPPMVNGDPDRLHQVLMNLINNAFKHGGSDVDVTITLRENLDRIVIEVADNGRGMAEEDAARIFDRFYRADASRHRAGGGGSGLGLAITKSLIEQHEGTITVDTAPGEGATFKISLPLLREVNGATATKATKATKAAQPAKDAKTPEKD